MATTTIDPREWVLAATRIGARRGFSLLELVVAVTILAAFLLPVLYLLSDARVCTVRTTRLRQVRDLAQQKLHERIHFHVEEDDGTFEEEGQPTWRWEVPPPNVKSQGQQVLLEYSIRVTVPFALHGGAGSASEAPPGSSGDETASLQSSADGSSYEYRVYAFPDERWYEEQDYLYSTGQPSILYGDPLTGEGGAGVGGLAPSGGTGF